MVVVEADFSVKLEPQAEQYCVNIVESIVRKFCVYITNIVKIFGI